jgi:hypothetical protein
MDGAHVFGKIFAGVAGELVQEAIIDRSYVRV